MNAFGDWVPGVEPRAEFGLVHAESSKQADVSLGNLGDGPAATRAEYKTSRKAGFAA